MNLAAAGMAAVVMGYAGCAGARGAPAADAAPIGDGGDGDASDAPDAGHPPDASTDAAPDASADAGADAAPDAGTAARCLTAADPALVIAVAAVADDHALTMIATSTAATRWSQPGNEAVVLEVASAARGMIGHLILHQGQRGFAYTMHLGQLVAGDPLSVRVSPLSSPATGGACIGTATVVAATAVGSAGDGIRHAPIFRWPVAKRFDDTPLLVGWSATTRSYQAVYSHENGGTVATCGGGAAGMEAELARWGRGCDIEGVFSYGGSSPTWGRCTGTTSFARVAPRLEGDHPVFYYGDGHNRLFEHRGGYGSTCGSGGAERADGDLAGWNVANPGNDEAHDAGRVITLRPLPVDLDALGFAAFAGRREGLVDSYAPWIYRLTFLELEREGRIDGTRTRAMDRYLYLDVHAADVDGSGDPVCSASVSRGFVVRVTSDGGPVQSGPQMTASYFGADPGWKRIAIALDRTYTSAEITGLIFDAYDNDGIYLLAMGDAFMVRADGDNGAILDRLHTGATAVGVYVDDDRGGCSGDVNHDGPGGTSYPCVGSDYRFTP